MTDQISAVPLANDIAAALGPGYTAHIEAYQERESQTVLVTTPSGHIFRVEPTGYRRPAHFRIAGKYSREGANYYVYSSDHAPEIKVSIHKTPARIAADIKRRFLGEFERVAELAQSRANQAETAHRAKVALYAALAETTGVIVDINRAERERNSEAVIYLHSSPPVQHGRIRIMGHNSVSIEISTNDAGARAIAGALFGADGVCAPREVTTAETSEIA